jgi:hypothetical protein
VTDAEFKIACITSEVTADASDVILMNGNTEWETNYATPTVDFLKQQAALAEISVLHEKTLAAVAATSQAPVHTPSEQILPATSEDAADASDVILKNVNTEWETANRFCLHLLRMQQVIVLQNNRNYVGIMTMELL